jgi:hypothetical protein
MAGEEMTFETPTAEDLLYLTEDDIPCYMAMMDDCSREAVWRVTLHHTDGTSWHDYPDLPMCDPHYQLINPRDFLVRLLNSVKPNKCSECDKFWEVKEARPIK